MLKKNNRQLQTKRGEETEKRIFKILEEYGFIYNTKGSYGEPDLVFNSFIESTTYGIECKRILGNALTIKGVNNVSFSLIEWKNLKEWCITNNAIPIVIIEIYIPKRNNFYFILKKDIIDKQFYKSKGNLYFGFSLWQIIDFGIKLKDFFENVK